MYSINPANPLPRRIEQKITYMICCKKYSPPFHNIMTIKSIKDVHKIKCEPNKICQ